MIRFRICVLACLIAAVASSAAFAQQGGFSPTTDDCYTALAAGSGVYLTRICISSSGNITKFEAGGVEYIHVQDVVEGYKVCRTDGYDSPFDLGAPTPNEWGYGPPTISQPNGRNTLPLRITRSAYPDIRLVQDFDLRSLPYGPTELLITMKVYNVGTNTIPNAEVTRLFDADINGDPRDDRGVATLDSAAVLDANASPRMMTLSAGILDKPHLGGWTDFTGGMNSFADSDPFCASFGQPAGLASADLDAMGWVRYQVGDILPGRVKTVQFIYRAQ